MRRLVLAAAFGFGLVGVAAAQDAEKALKELQGEYTVKELVRAGKADEEEAKSVEKMVIKDDQLTLYIKGREEPAKIKLDPSKKPGHIDISPTRGDKGETIPGIYKYEKGTLTIAFAKGKDATRPKDFDAKGENDMKAVFVKKDAK
jgi:uncharacterized protein (TIGR03067 family)